MRRNDNIQSIQNGFSSEEFSDFRSSRKAVYISIAAISSYTLFGTVVLSIWVDGWNAADALYFTVATVTTVGYGDIYPVTPGQRLFGIFFGVFGILVLGNVALGIVFDQLINTFQKTQTDTKKSSQDKFMSRFETNSRRNSLSSTGADADADADEDEDGNNSESSHSTSSWSPEEKQKQRIRVIMTNLVLIILGIIVPAIIIGIIEGWSVIDILYYASITATTIGYGDLSPKTLSTRLIAVFYLPLCVSIMGKIFRDTTASFMAKRAQEAEDNFYNRKFTLDDLRAMDAGKENGDGSVSVGEFLEFMLVTMNKVSREDMKELKHLYNDLDTDADGSLTINDLEMRVFGGDTFDENMVDGVGSPSSA